MDYASLGLSVREFLFSIKMASPHRIEHTMQFELVELYVPTCSDENCAEVVEQALRLNRGLSVLSLGGPEHSVVRKILSSLIPDQNGQQANECQITQQCLSQKDCGHPGNTQLDLGSGYENDGNKFHGDAP